MPENIDLERQVKQLLVDLPNLGHQDIEDRLVFMLKPSPGTRGERPLGLDIE